MIQYDTIDQSSQFIEHDEVQQEHDLIAHIRIRKLKEQSDFRLSIWEEGGDPMPQTIRNGPTQFSFAFHVAAITPWGPAFIMILDMRTYWAM